MKRTFYILLILLTVGVFTSCEKERIMFDESMSFVAFTAKTTSVGEVNKTVNIPVLVTATSGKPSVEVSYAIVSQEEANPAIEGTDFVVKSAATLKYPDGNGYDNIVIETIDNNVFTGTKTFKIVLTTNTLSYDFGAIDTIVVSIPDDDHPLGWMLGNYDSKVTETANGSTEHPVTISAIEGETAKVNIYGMSGTAYGAPLADPYFIVGTVNEDFTKLIIKTEQEWASWGYGPTSLNAWEDDNGEGIEVEELIGEISNVNGAVTIIFRQQYTFMITDGGNAGLGLQWAWNSDTNPNSETAVWTRK